MAVPHFAAVLMPLPSFVPRPSAFSSVLDMLFSASSEFIKMLPNSLNISMPSPAFVLRHNRQHFFFDIFQRFLSVLILLFENLFFKFFKLNIFQPFHGHEWI